MRGIDRSFEPGFAPALPGRPAGIGGRLRERPEDFLVEEIPLYEPSGEGEHIYLFVEKRGMSTMEMVGLIARHFGVRRRDVGYAGLKDKRAITRQLVSVWAPKLRIEDVPMLSHDRVAILWADRHGNKLRPGHLKSNRFSIRVRGVAFHAAVHAQRVLARLAREGLPNRIGEQRFGYLANNHLVGRALVLGRWAEAVELLLGPDGAHPDAQPEGRRLFREGRHAEALAHFHESLRTEREMLRALASGATPQEAVRRMDRSVAAYYVTAFQSALFNAVLNRREADGTLGVLVEGDIAFMHASRATFVVGPAELSDPEMPGRLARFEVSPSGPMWGTSMRRAGGAVGSLELGVLEASGSTEADLLSFEREGGAVEGARRPLRVPVIDPDVEGGADEHGGYVRCAFELPRGSFATSVMREIMGAGGPIHDEEE
ncbi:MAG TPA: tRNA pseudouridine(13) synthase TruD [Phycisphaerales bacterium]|nr:tRNA pseudouridine(13) synthase TruD [Phycisphaerales bacterium]